MKFAWMRKLYSECFAFLGVFQENIREIPGKCEIKQVYSWPKRTSRNFKENFTQFLGEFHSIFKKISRNFQKSFLFIQSQVSNDKVTSESQDSYKYTTHVSQVSDNKAIKMIQNAYCNSELESTDWLIPIVT